MKYINCQQYAQEILDHVRAVPDKRKLVIISVGEDPASQSYIKGKIKDCEYCGIPYEHVRFRADERDLEVRLIYVIGLYNRNPSVGGIIVQLPLPDHIDAEKITQAVYRSKDIDGFRDNSWFKPCTPEGIMYLLHKEVGDITGKHALIVGRGKLVGEPIAKMLLEENCTVTIAHSKTEHLDLHLSMADIVISAVGKPNTVPLLACINAEVVIDCGVSRNEDGKLVGDCYDFHPDWLDELKVTPVPKGVGLMTRAMLMSHMVPQEVDHAER